MTLHRAKVHKSSRLAGWIVLLVVMGSRADAVEVAAGLAVDAETLVAQLDRVDVGGQGHVNAMSMMGQWLSREEPVDARLLATLSVMSQATPRAKNWLRMIAGELAKNAADRQAMKSSLRPFFDDRTNDPDARYWVYRQLIQGDSATEAELLGAATDDPSIPLRFLAIAKGMKEAKSLAESDAEPDRQAAITRYQSLLPLARHPDQLRDITSALKDLGQPVNLSEQLAMISTWWLIGPFDNTNGVGFDTVTPIETEYAVAPLEEINVERPVVTGKQSVTWQRRSTDDSMGEVDLNPVFDKAKDAMAYGFALIRIDESELAAGAQARLGSINANQVWVNGQLVLSNEIYHSGSSIDQYVGPCELKPGLNSVLVKILQNDQTQSWAQDWKFQFRLTDATGRGIRFESVSPSP